MTDPFGEVVTSAEELRALIGTPAGLAAHKVIHHLDAHCRAFIAQSPFLLIATANATGECDASPRGDAPGFVSVLDEQRLLIPERRGNRRVDSMLNILSNPHVGLIFLIPGLGETLRINGRAHVVRNRQLLSRLDVNGVPVQVGIGVEVEECYIQCAKAVVRSQLWRPESWPAREELPNTARMLADHTKVLGLSEQEVKDQLAESYTKRLY